MLLLDPQGPEGDKGVICLHDSVGSDSKESLCSQKKNQKSFNVGRGIIPYQKYMLQIFLFIGVIFS